MRSRWRAATPRAYYSIGCADIIERQLKQPLRRVSPGAKERNPRATPLTENLPKAEQKNVKGIKKGISSEWKYLLELASYKSNRQKEFN
jgi:hypothetical protein